MPHFNGPEYSPEHDHTRLTNQFERIKEVMLDGQWRTLEEISRLTGDPHASISAQLRHLRKPRFGSYQVERRARGDREDGLFEYRVNGKLTPAEVAEQSLTGDAKALAEIRAAIPEKRRSPELGAMLDRLEAEQQPPPPPMGGLLEDWMIGED